MNTEEGKAAVKTIPTLGHQPVILGGLYSAVEDEFLPGKIIMIIVNSLNCYYNYCESLLW